MAPETMDIPKLANEFTAAHPDLDAREQHLALAAFRLLGEGQAFGAEQLADRAGLPVEEVAPYVDEGLAMQRDRHGWVVAFGGLSLEPTSHVLEVDGRTLYAWCALDTLFLPERLGRPARVHSTCPQTGQAISLSVDAAGVHDVSPQSAVMSLRGAAGLDLADAIGSFCCYVHFFASEAAARIWTEGKEGTYVASISQGFEYGRVYNHGLLGAALEAQEA